MRKGISSAPDMQTGKWKKQCIQAMSVRQSLSKTLLLECRFTQRLKHWDDRSTCWLVLLLLHQHLFCQRSSTGIRGKETVFEDWFANCLAGNVMFCLQDDFIWSHGSQRITEALLQQKHRFWLISWGLKRQRVEAVVHLLCQWKRASCKRVFPWRLLLLWNEGLRRTQLGICCLWTWPCLTLNIKHLVNCSSNGLQRVVASD